MRIHTFDGKQYVALGDLNHLRKNLIADIRDKYERGEDGQIHMTPEDVGQIGAYSHLMVEVLKDQLHVASEEATDAKSLRENHDRVYNRIKREWEEGKYAIVATDLTQEKPGECYFVRIDESEDGETETPVFTDMKRKAYAFEDYHDATCRLEWLKEHTKDMGAAVTNLRILPMFTLYMTNNTAKRLLNAIFGDEDDGHEYCIFLEPMGGDNGSWFSQWIKHRDDLPQGTKGWLVAAGVEPGESVPMFTGGKAPIMRFKYKGMAEKTAEKIAEMYPEFEGRLHVMKYEDGEKA